VMMPPALAPAMPPSTETPSAETPAPAAENSTPAAEEPAQDKPAQEQPTDDEHDESTADTRVLRAVTDVDADPTTPHSRPDAQSQSEAPMEIDGDATVMVPPSELPAGTEHLRGGSDPKKG
jgi:hypothetical protein